MEKKLKCLTAIICMLTVIGTNSIVFAANERNEIDENITENEEIVDDSVDESKIDDIKKTDTHEEQTEVIDFDNPENTIQDNSVISVDENGKVFSIDDDNGGVVQDEIATYARTASPKIVNFRANQAGNAVNDVTTYTEYKTGASGYVYGKSGADAAYLGEENGKIKFMQSGVVGLVDKSKVQVVNLNSVKTYSNYYANGSSIIHQICMNMTISGYGGTTNIGPQQSYMKTGTTYYSYDGHYFYTNYTTMISDYQNNTRTNSINPNNPYYNYYQYLPLRGKSLYSGNELVNIINTHASKASKMYNKGTQFVNNQNTYGVNALIMTGVGALESAWGTSSISQQKNNLFGLNAVDSSPGQSANTFSSVDACIKDFAETYMSKRYLRAGWSYYHGGFLGNKASGINVSYASDPYWGEKIASLVWTMDREGGKKDQNKYAIGIKDTIATDHTSLNVRKEASTSTAKLYSTGVSSNYAFLILGESSGFYRVQSDPVLNNGRTQINTSSGVYSTSGMYAYASKDYIKKINTVSTGNNNNNNDTQNRLVLINGVYYCYRGNSKMYGEQRVNNAWYYFDKSSGAMRTGFVNLGNKTVYYGTDGKMRYGEQRISNAWYYFDKVSGAMRTGFVNLGNKTVYYGTDGKMRYGEQRISNAWYYFDKVSGAMRTGFVNLGNKTVYYGTDGKMRYGEQRISNAWYCFDKVSGAMRTGFVNLGNKTVYYGTDGKMRYGEQRISNAWYCFDKVSGAMQIDSWYNGHYYGKDGVRKK